MWIETLFTGSVLFVEGSIKSEMELKPRCHVADNGSSRLQGVLGGSLFNSRPARGAFPRTCRPRRGAIKAAPASLGRGGASRGPSGQEGPETAELRPYVGSLPREGRTTSPGEEVGPAWWE